MNVETITGAGVVALGPELLALCEAAFDSFDPAYLLGRLADLDAPAATLARDDGGRLVGFKLGYRRAPDLFYSWLGGVHPDARRQGIAARLMAAQHDWARTQGYAAVETRTRASNNAMIVLNLQSGFHVAGFEVDSAGRPVVTQRRALS
ncbi:GNAT family N-acetyltransferase [Sphingoaurantiacus capsulatus]|uniref:GNAT family N-acetyltransferase n=1 Tax=Sphingoaurantiacus capsulatus TaxID=1771310 RepID=A0ABV7XAW7_9SPHN